MAEPLPAPRLAAALAQLPGWRHHQDALQVEWRFPGFMAAMAFMGDAAAEIDRLDHHPEWGNAYDRVWVRLTTHDAGDRVTARDVELAKILAWVAERHRGPGG